ncbi:hypothetical protein N5K21_28930 [Rhizobium pusense]|uniref:hypothetical protein n=1 Tax=Agrobacterium pusense TaxID=648995 RepID=UPI002447089D|nr:hypothetical protein [Agrobacterium pusense]MDH2092721.1 hypothetical protein [Agrobacterium pusense]
MNMIEFRANPVAEVQAGPQTITLVVTRAASALANAKSAAEILDARDMASVAYDAAKKAARFARAKKAHDDVISAVYRAQADALEIESMAKRRLADEYDAAQERGEIASHGGGRNFKVPEGNVETITTADIGLSRKDIHEARIIRDAEVAEPGIARRALDARLAQGQEPTKAALREAVTEAAMRGIRGTGAPAPSNKNPLYRAPTKAGAAWSHLYGTCRALSEWATDENQLLALHGKAERSDDQTANLRAIRRAASFLNDFLEQVDA